jgi:hypothetical protein
VISARTGDAGQSIACSLQADSLVDASFRPSALLLKGDPERREGRSHGDRDVGDVVVGVVGGYFVGRAWAEIRRARYDMDRVWESRKNYRDD